MVTSLGVEFVYLNIIEYRSASNYIYVDVSQVNSSFCDND
jgi:hypothetical protein